MADGRIPVRVALRCRPLIHKEILEGCQQCVEFIPNEPQIVVGGDKAFTFDFVYHPTSEQEHLYHDVVRPLVKNIFKGYNATVLAYGQTGSGKTYTMGTVYTGQEGVSEKDLGVIPRVVREIFDIVEEKPEHECLLKVTFLEIYNEDVLDLLVQTKNRNNREELQIREDMNGDIKVAGLQEVEVKTFQETLQCLEQGAVGRTTGATAMNTQSSRSHAIFTIHIEQKLSGSLVKSKFHLVDLAGSERAKRTKAQGERFKEGVNINRGLLALGNVISALGKEGSGSHVPYRDSKLTRLLQDSLGGNSHTAMVACISPADSNLEETVNTLRYADRARKIKNKPIINRDPHAAELARLRQLVHELQMQVIPTQLNGTSVEPNGMSITALQNHIQVLEMENQKLSKELRNSLHQTTTMCEKAILAETAREKLKKKLAELQEKAGLTAADLNMSLDTSINAPIDFMKEIQEKIMELQADQQEDVNLYSSDKDDSETMDGDSPDKFSTEYALRHAEMNRELQDLNRALAVKEDLARKMACNESKMHVTLLNQQYEGNVKQLEEEVALLQAEKEDLSAALRAAHNNPSNKLSEQRRKRLQELEAQLAQLKKKMNEQAKIIRMKQQTEERVKQLNHEIQAMKQTRVKLMKQMREEQDKFRQWRQEKDREVAKLKHQDRKRQYEFVKMERMHAKQQNVLRRKMEDAVAVNKRLKDALAKRISITDKRNDAKNPDAVGNKVRNWLTQELELVVSAKEASHHLKDLIEDRKTISSQLSALKKKCDEGYPPRKKVMFGEDSSESSDLEAPETEERIAELQRDLEMRNVQIADLQQKLMDADQEEKSKHRWESIQSMVEAKCALKWLFDVAARARCEEALKNMVNRELNNNYEEAVTNLEETREEMRRMQYRFAEETLNLERMNENKVLFLLQQLPKATTENDSPKDNPQQALLDRLKFQDEEIARFAAIHEELEQKVNECEALKKELTLVHCKGKKTSLMPDLCDFSGSPLFPATPQVRPKAQTTKRMPVTRFLPLDAVEDEPDDDDSFLDDDALHDPDWQKTPILRRAIRRTKTGIKRPSIRLSGSDSDSTSENVPPKAGSKRSSSDLSCKCKTNCRTKKCKCRKQENFCSDMCGCAETCLNRLNSSQKNSFSEDQADKLETSSRTVLSTSNVPTIKTV